MERRHRAVLPPVLAGYVETCVNVGRYASEEEVVRAGLLALRRRSSRSAGIALRNKLRLGREQVDRGELIPAEVVIARQREKRRSASL